MKRLMKIFAVLGLLFLLVGLLLIIFRKNIYRGVSKTFKRAVTQHSSYDTSVVIIKDSGERLNLKVEKAETTLEKTKGLMFREEMCENCGMLFYYSSDVKSGFWMKNCEISLDIIFINSKNEIVDIKKGFEPCVDDDCPVYAPDEYYRYALEVNGGWAEKNDVKVGDILEL
jgi:hypothetical protein